MSARLCDKDPEAGFTLIEILCVLVIIGVMTGVVALNMRAPGAQGPSLEDQLVTRFNLMAKESIFSGRSHGFSVTETGLQFMSYENEDWVILYNLDFSDGERAALSVEDEVVELPKLPTPLVIFEPTGEVSEFLFSLRGYNGDIIISSRHDGTIGLGIDDKKAFQ